MAGVSVESGVRRRDYSVAARGWNGPAEPNRRDEGVAEAVANALYWDFALPRHRVVALCDDGWVTLSGQVDRAYQRSCAEADVKRVNGVRGVTNAITVGAAADAGAAVAEKLYPGA